MARTAQYAVRWCGVNVPFVSTLLALALVLGGCGRRPVQREPATRPRDARTHAPPQSPRERDALVLAALDSALPPLRPAANEVPAPSSALPRATETDAALERAVASGRYVRLERPPFDVYLPAAESPALEPYLTELLASADAALSVRYGVALEPRVRIDLYDDADAYGARVRGGGLEGDAEGAYGARRIALLSPSAGARAWGETLWHEVAHAFQDRAARGRLPRMLAEGLAERDTRAARSEWRREPEGDVAALVRGDASEFIARLDRALSAASTERGAAYFVAARLVSCVVDAQGDEAVRAWIRGRAAGQNDDAAIEAVSGRPLAALLPACFAPFVRVQGLPSLDVPPLTPGIGAEGAEARARASAIALREGRVTDARSHADAALALASSPLALYVRARVALLERDVAAEAFLRRMVDGGVDVYEARIALARAALARDDVAEALRHMRAAIALDEGRREAWDLALRLSDESNTIDRDDALRHVADIDERAAGVCLEVVERAAARGDHATVTTYGERLLYSDPLRAGLHARLAVAYRARGDMARAARECSVLGALSPDAARAACP